MNNVNIRYNSLEWIRIQKTVQIATLSLILFVGYRTKWRIVLTRDEDNEGNSI